MIEIITGKNPNIYVNKRLVSPAEGVREIKRKLSINALQLAQLLNISASTVNKWTAGTRKPNKTAYFALKQVVEGK